MLLPSPLLPSPRLCRLHCRLPCTAHMHLLGPSHHSRRWRLSRTKVSWLGGRPIGCLAQRMEQMGPISRPMPRAAQHHESLEWHIPGWGRSQRYELSTDPRPTPALCGCYECASAANICRVKMVGQSGKEEKGGGGQKRCMYGSTPACGSSSLLRCHVCSIHRLSWLGFSSHDKLRQLNGRLQRVERPRREPSRVISESRRLRDGGR